MKLSGEVKIRQRIDGGVDKPSVFAAPMIGDNDNWFVWTPGAGYVDTGISAKGEKGDKGDKGDTGRSGGAVIGQTLDADGMYINEINTVNAEWTGGSY